MIIFSIIFLIIFLKRILCINSYIYLNDKLIQEELSIGTVIFELNDELNKYYYSHSSQFQSPSTSFADQHYTFLDEIQTRFASSTYFLLDSFTGRVTTKRYIDRESMCLNRHCMELCVENQLSHINNGSSLNQCKLNLKILLQPSSNIVSINIIVDDINDNKPQFRKELFNQSVPENVPIGYRIPIELAFDPDVGRNSIQYYEIVEYNSNFNTIKDTFELKQNLNEMQLAIVVKKKLDREVQSAYSFSIIAHDGGLPSFSGRLDCLIQILDINDNNPQFDHDFYKFTLREDTRIGTQVGYLQAYDLDEGLNARIKYSLVGSLVNNVGSNSILHNYASYFDIDLYTGLLTLRKQLDYEDEPVFSLTIEARDCGVGSLPAYATVEITLIDCNDNPPEISVSFLNSLKRKITGTELGFNSYSQPLIIYLNENTEVNKFISHVSITDKDSFENGKINWIVELNKENLVLNDSTNYLKIALLNNNSFTINTGKRVLDREEIQLLNVTIIAWDHNGIPISNNATYTFQIEVIDENDNKPKFDSNVYNLTIYENNKISDIITQFNANDADIGENGRITYKIKDSLNRLDDKLFTIESATGILRARKVFDREQRYIYRFYVTATDNGPKQQLSTSVLVNLRILDVNDNEPKIYFIKNQTKYFDSYSEKNQTLVLILNENLAYNTQIIQFNANDSDINENTQVRFYINETQRHFRLNEISGQLFLVKKLDREQSSLHTLKIICENVVGSFLSNNTKLSSSINLIIKVADINDNCPYGINLTEKRFIDTSKLNTSNNLFRLKYSDLDESINSRLAFTLLTYKHIFELKAKYDTISELYDIEINLKQSFLLDKLKLGKYVIKLKISDYGEPKCEIINHYQLFVGNNIFNTYGLLNEALKNNKEKSSSHEQHSDYQYDQINEDYDYNMRMKQIFNTDEYEFEINSTLSSPTDTSTTEITINDTILDLNKFKRSRFNFIDFDHILVFIMVLIIVLIAILITLLAAVYFYKKYSQIRIKKILKNSDSINSSNTDTNNSIDDFEKLKYEQQQYYFLKKQQKERMQSYSITNNSSNLSPDALYASNNLSISLQSTNDDSLASSAITKETKLNNLSVNDHKKQSSIISSASLSSSKSGDGIRNTNHLPLSSSRSIYSGYSHPLSSNRSFNSINNKRDEIIVIDNYIRNGGAVRQQMALPISTINNNTSLYESKSDSIYSKRKEKIDTNNNKDIHVHDDDEEEDEEYNEKFSFLNEYKTNSNSYKNSDL